MTTKDGIKHIIKSQEKRPNGKVTAKCGKTVNANQLIDDSEATMECWKCGRVGK